MNQAELFRLSRELLKEGTEIRRDLHRYPESGFLEYRTASVIIKTLTGLGYTVQYGSAVNDTSCVAGLPTREEQEACMRRAIAEGADPALVREMADGKTGVVGILDGTAGGAGQTVAFRFDIDANDASEASEDDHRPAREGFDSVHENVMHACGHDGHVAIGLLLARLLSERRDSFSGQIRLIFQPAEEGVRGAQSMLAAGVTDGVDVFFGGHIGLSAEENGMLIASIGDFLAASKFDAEFTGKSSHAGVAPEEGRNALLASAQAAIALHAISRHGKGASRINVGVLRAGTGRNVLPDHAVMEFETRGATKEINGYMEREARRIISASADLYGVTAALSRIGYADDFIPDPVFGKEIADYARSLGIYETVLDSGRMCASEDCTAFLNAVTASGGRAIYMMFGTKRMAGHHNGRFDFDESVISNAAVFLSCLARKYACRITEDCV